MPEEPVIPQGDANQPGVPDQGQGHDTYVPLTRSQAESLQRERDESRASERAWSEIARGSRQPAPEPVNDLPDASEFASEDETPAGIPDDTPAKLVDDFAATGVAALQKRGFITAADALKLAREVAIKVSSELIGRNQQRTSTDQKIVTEFPDLKSPESALFKETALRYRRAVEMDPNAAKTPAALYLAAEGARDHLKAQKAKAPPADEGEIDDAEVTRRARADSQDGSRTRGRGEVADDDMLGTEARTIIKGMGISAEEFQASRKELKNRGGR